jgi:hypothetical protein
VRKVVLRGRTYSDFTAKSITVDARTIGICQVLRSWLRAGIIDELDPIFVYMADESIPQLNDDYAGAVETATWLDATPEDVKEGENSRQ